MKKRDKKAQVSMEYMIVIGFVTFVVLVLLIQSFFYKRQVEKQVETTQAEQIVRSIIDTSEQVYYVGKPTKTTLKVYMPSGVQSIEFPNGTLLMKIRTQSGISDITYPSKVNITGTLSPNPGIRYIKVESRGTYVWVYV